ncbi:nitrogenase MoFe cofactor biosynthesis protein NifE [Calothrix sp. NIES-4071]|nr:nitrogenase MoFe cofactor biosynthesis protein NifE [Calothrix sp. NIES-4071]BAZ58169.1 nitrogenase MoFe cofactor biosynthesis protein NifE [Calothrix sp. NIES-4105]
MKASHDKIEDFSDGHKSSVQNQQDCAFDGAFWALVNITDAAHLIHGPTGCAGSFSSGSDNTAMLNKIRFTTDMEESDIIFGGAKKLYKAILEVHRRYNPAAIFVYSTCVSAMIGDDVNGATHDATEKLGIPVIPVDSPGFIGNKNSGIRLAGDVLIQHVIGTAEPGFTTDYDINLISDNSLSGTVELELLLEKIGIRVLAKITYNSQFNEIRYAHRAKLNVIISSKPLLKMAKQMEKRFGISYIQESLYSIEEINNCLRNIAAKLNNAELKQKTEKLIAERNKNLNSQLDLYRSQFKDKRIVIDVANCNFSFISIAKDLNVDIIPIAKQLNSEDKVKIQKLLNKDVIFLQPENETNQIIDTIKGWAADMLVAPISYQHIAIITQIPFLNSQNQYTHAGYTGITEAVRSLYTAFKSPVLKQLNFAAPWE